MYQVRRKNTVGCEDLMREMAAIEQNLLALDGALAMDMMVLETKIRERFHLLETMVNSSKAPSASDQPALSIEDIQALIPYDLPAFPTLNDFERRRKRQKVMETVGTAALLAIVTALGVFGLASILQLGLSWLA